MTRFHPEQRRNFLRSIRALMGGIGLATMASLLASGCVGLPGKPPDVSKLQPGAGEDNRNDAIPLSPSADVNMTLVSTPRASTFVVSGLGEGLDVVIPSTSIAKIKVPAKPLNITAIQPCFPNINSYVQVNKSLEGQDIKFSFSNANRIPDCYDPEPAAVGKQITSPTGAGSTGLVWVIVADTYTGDWPFLSFVKSDRQNVVDLFKRSGHQVLVSYNRSLAQLQADRAAFRKQMTSKPWQSVVVYISGHGVGAQQGSFVVPADALRSSAVQRENLLEVAAIAQDLDSAAPASAYKIVLVDTCRTASKAVSEVPSGTAPLTAVPQGVSVNYAVSAESKAFQGESGMSAWTERFVVLAEAYPYLEIDQFVKYANRYTDWQTRTMAGTQHPVMTGTQRTKAPPLSTVRKEDPGKVVARIP
jgi:hypothetical protein